jgi:hypothetical protein
MRIAAVDAVVTSCGQRSNVHHIHSCFLSKHLVLFVACGTFVP